MQLAVFILTYPLLWLVSKLPFRALYVLSDLFFPLMYHVIGYRKKVVRNNLALVFPDKNISERLVIEKKFFRYMCDVFLEMIKTMGITRNQMLKRFTYTNLDTLLRLEESGRRVILMVPHYASWEWLLSLNELTKLKAYAIYLKLNNKYFDKLVRDIRSKFGTSLIRTYETRSTLNKLVNSNELFTIGIASDQSPMLSRARHWHKFMGIMVPVHVGGEELSKEHNLIPVFIKVKRLKRGFYQGTSFFLAFCLGINSDNWLCV